MFMLSSSCNTILGCSAWLAPQHGADVQSGLKWASPALSYLENGRQDNSL